MRRARVTGGRSSAPVGDAGRSPGGGSGGRCRNGRCRPRRSPGRRPAGPRSANRPRHWAARPYTGWSSTGGSRSARCAIRPSEPAAPTPVSRRGAGFSRGRKWTCAPPRRPPPRRCPEIVGRTYGWGGGISRRNPGKQCLNSPAKPWGWSTGTPATASSPIPVCGRCRRHAAKSPGNAAVSAGPPPPPPCTTTRAGAARGRRRPGGGVRGAGSRRMPDAADGRTAGDLRDRNRAVWRTGAGTAVAARVRGRAGRRAGRRRLPPSPVVVPTDAPGFTHRHVPPRPGPAADHARTRADRSAPGRRAPVGAVRDPGRTRSAEGVKGRGSTTLEKTGLRGAADMAECAAEGRWWWRWTGPSRCAAATGRPPSTDSAPCSPRPGRPGSRR